MRPRGGVSVRIHARLLLMIRATLLLLMMSLVAPPARGALTVQVNYTGDPIYEPFFDSAAAQWESLLVGYQDGAIQAVSPGSSYVGQPLNTPLTTVYINAVLAPNDGVGGVLGSAGPSEVAIDASGYWLTTDGQMSFDSADAAGLVTGGTFGSVVLHEMAHVLGFGTLWSAATNNVYDGAGEFTGAAATAQWQSEFGQTGTPDVELAGGPGTAGGHWNEVDFGAGLTGITSTDGDLRNELMTGWLNGPTFISDMTIASFQDIGFTTVLAMVPEASPFVALGLLFAAGSLTGRRG